MKARPLYHPTRFCAALAALALAGAPGRLAAYQTPAPPFLEVEVVMDGPGGAAPVTLAGELHFSTLRVQTKAVDAVRGLWGKDGGWHIKFLTPVGPGAVRIERSADAADPFPFILKMPLAPPQSFRFAFDAVAVSLSTDSQIARLATTSLTSATPEIEAITLDEPAAAAAPAQDPPETRAAGVFLALPKAADFTSIPVQRLRRITFLRAAGGYRREFPRGRFVEYNNAAKGDDGKVQPLAATFFGGKAGGECFRSGAFRNDGSIVLIGNFDDVAFVGAAPVHVVGGADPAADAFRDAGADAKGRPLPSRRLTLAAAQYSPDLRELRQVVRLPWAAAVVDKAAVGSDDALYASVSPGPHFDEGLREIGRVRVVENPGAVANAKSRGREPGADTALVRFAPDLRRIEWALRFKHGGIGFAALPGGRLVVQRYQDIFYVEADGSVTNGPVLEAGRSATGVVTDPRDGSMYLGGEYHSGTGLEPYRNPFLYKLDRNGRFVWTAYDWTGPVVGVEQLRLVSDSRIGAIRVGEDGNLVVSGWSDGGNSVLNQQPYDVRKGAPSDGFAGSGWGAKVLSVAHLINMNGQSQEVTGHCCVFSYLAFDDIPNSISIRDFGLTRSGDFAFTGGSASGFIETHDAWVKPWYVEYRTNPYADARGGGFFCVYTGDMRRPRMCTLVPGLENGQLAFRGDKVLLFGSCRPQHAAYGLGAPAMTPNAVQPAHGGGELDAYAMLIDTQGPAHPPAIPPKSWTVEDLKAVPQ